MRRRMVRIIRIIRIIRNKKGGEAVGIERVIVQ